MKKKLAILLVLSMIISMIPMNVFGATTIRPLNSFLGAGEYAKTEVWIDLAEYWDYFTQSDLDTGTVTRMSIRVLLTGATWSNNYLADYDGDATNDNTVVKWNGDNSQTWNQERTARPGNYYALEDYEAYDTIVGIPDAYVPDYSATYSLSAAVPVIETPVRSAPQGSAASLGSLYYRFDPASSTEGYIRLYDKGDFNEAAFQVDQRGYVSIPIYYHVTESPATLEVWDYNNQRPLTWQLARRSGDGIIPGYGDPVSFHTFVTLNAITLKESVSGQLTDSGKGADWTLRVEAPLDYRWNYLWNTDADDDEVKVSSVYGGRYVQASLIDVRHEIIDGHDVLWIYFSADPGLSQDISYGFLETLSFENIGLVADDRAPMGEVNVGVKFQKWLGAEYGGKVLSGFLWNATGTPASSLAPTHSSKAELLALQAAHPAFSPVGVVGDGTGTGAYIPYYGLGDWEDRTWEKTNWGDVSGTNLHVANRVANEVWFALATDEVVLDVRSGELEQKLAKVALWEIAPNAWGATAGIDATFTVDEGVKINRAELFLEDSLEGYKQGNGSDDDNNVYAVSLKNFEGNYMPTNEGVLLKPDSLRVTIPLQNQTDIKTARLLEVQLWVSIEAGYEWKYGTTDLNVHASGNSLTNMPSDQGSVVAGKVADPIILSVDTVVPVITNNTAYYAGDELTEVGEITVTETAAGNLVRGEELWVYAIGGRVNDVEVLCDPQAVVDSASGLQLSQGRPTRHSYANTLYEGMVFTVTHESRNNPATITFTGVKLLGYIYPEVDYQVVVSGNAIAENDYLVFEEAKGNTVSVIEEQLLFSNAPYNSSFYSFDDVDTNIPGGTGYADAPAATDPAAPVEQPPVVAPYVPEGPTAWTINESTPGKEGYPNPFIRRNGVGLGHVGAIAEFLGLEASWDDSIKTATLTGTDKYGAPLEIILVQNDTNGIINGVSYDIGTKTGSGAPGTITVLNENNAIYLPLRFVHEAYGGTIAWDPATNTATLYK
jgi:hypothetical protein